MRPASHMGRAAALIKGTVPTYSARGATVKRPWVMSELPYRPGVGVMLLNRQRHVFVGQRLDSTAEAWPMPQGGIDKGEEPRVTAPRAMEEETGTAPRRVATCPENPRAP